MKFRDVQPPPSDPPPQNAALPVSLDDENGDDWLSAPARAAARDTEVPEIGPHNHLDFLNLEALALVDVSADVPCTAETNPGHDSVPDSIQEVVQRAADVDWN